MIAQCLNKPIAWLRQQIAFAQMISESSRQPPALGRTCIFVEQHAKCGIAECNVSTWGAWHQSNGKTYYGIDNTNSSSRFSFIGEAKVTPSIKVTGILSQ